jgi:Family of unknown function (DUF6132)
MKKLLSPRLLLGIALGALGGWLYWRFVGCANGTCAITSSPVNSTLYGALMGGLLVSSFTRTASPSPDQTDRS